MSEALTGRGAQGRIGTVIKGKWQIDARIGSGGMATVYAATHRNGNRAAIKMLHMQLSRDATLRGRFLREGYVANAVNHPAVVAVLDDGETEDGAVYLVLELLEGETIEARRLRLGGKLPIEEALNVADEALDALAAAHEKGIVHRDVKPENVFFTKDGHIKLLDFGLARMKDVESEATQTGVTIGTPEFMPPEQAAGRRDAVDARSDIWGLGATVFTAITGRYVHDDAQSLHEQLIASATRRSRPIRQLAPQVTPAVSLVIDRALELEMSDRWQGAREMQAALRDARDRQIDAHQSITMHIAMPMDQQEPTQALNPAEFEPTASLDAASVAAARAMAQASFEPTQNMHVGPRPHGPVPPPPPATTRMHSALASWPPPPEGSPSPEGPLHGHPSPHALPLMPPMRGPMASVPPGLGRDLDPISSVRHPPVFTTPPRRSSWHVLAILSVLLFALIAAMGAYVLWRRGRLPF